MIEARDLPQLAGLVGLEIAAERTAATLQNLQRIEQVAALLDAVELGPQDELGPEWKP